MIVSLVDTIVFPVLTGSDRAVVETSLFPRVVIGGCVVAGDFVASPQPGHPIISSLIHF